MLLLQDSFLALLRGGIVPVILLRGHGVHDGLHVGRLHTLVIGDHWHL